MRKILLSFYPTVSGVAIILGTGWKLIANRECQTVVKINCDLDLCLYYEKSIKWKIITTAEERKCIIKVNNSWDIIVGIDVITIDIIKLLHSPL